MLMIVKMNKEKKVELRGVVKRIEVLKEEKKIIRLNTTKETFQHGHGIKPT